MTDPLNPLPTIADFVDELASSATQLQTETLSLRVTEMTLDLPMELSVNQSGDDHISLFAGPPTQRTETSILPVFHRLRMRITQDEE